MESALSGTKPDHDTFDLADMRFHRAIMLACHSDLLGRMTGVVFGALLVSFQATSRLPGSAKASLPNHRAILDAIQAGDGKRAAKAMHRLVHTTAREVDAFSKRQAGRGKRKAGAART